MVSREETASSEEIDEFRLKEEREERGEPVIEVSDLEDELDVPLNFPFHV